MYQSSLISYLHILNNDYWHYLYYRSLDVDRPILEDKQRFPDSSFSASASSEGHSASDGRISSGSSWCAPVSNETHYLQVDFGRLYYVYALVTYGDSTSSKWVAKYSVNFTVDLLNWTTRVRNNDITKIYAKSRTYCFNFKQFQYMTCIVQSNVLEVDLKRNSRILVT